MSDPEMHTAPLSTADAKSIYDAAYARGRADLLAELFPYCAHDGSGGVKRFPNYAEAQIWVEARHDKKEQS